MFMADILSLLCEKAKIPNKNVFYFLNQVELQLKCFNSSLMKIVALMGNFEIWALAFRIFNVFADNGINVPI